MKYLLLFVLFLSSICHATDKSFIQFENGQVHIGQSYLNLSLANFSIHQYPKHASIKTAFLRDSLRWVRTQDNVFTPQAEMRIQIRGTKSDNFFIRFGNETITPSFSPQKKLFSFTLSTQLFRQNTITIFNSTKIVTKIEIEALPKKAVKSHYIDSSCIPYHLTIRGFENQYLSLFCVLERIGHFGHERPKLKVFWLTPNFSLNSSYQNSSITTFSSTSSSNITLFNRKGEKRILQIAVKLPSRLHRIKTAMGLGAYQFRTKNSGVMGVNDIVPDITLYGKIDFNAKSSFRFFNAFNKKGALFNNFGLYFAYDLANIMNNNIKVVALLGLQHVYYQYQAGFQSKTQMIAPQGGEITWRHPFGIQNYLLGGGALLSMKDSITYTNGWIRFGKKLMVELNYIDWGYNGDYAQIFGLSLIYPLVSFF